MLLILGLISCRDNHVETKVCLPNADNRDIFINEGLRSIESKFSSLEKADFYTGPLSCYVYINKIKNEVSDISHSFYFFFKNDKLCAIDAKYEISIKDSSAFNWIRRSAFNCYHLKNCVNDSCWEFKNNDLYVSLRIGKDNLNPELYSCWYFVCLQAYCEIINKPELSERRNLPVSQIIKH